MSPPSGGYHAAVPSALVEATEAAIAAHEEGRAPLPEEVHQEMRSTYTWEDIARRTIEVSVPAVE